MKKFQKTLEDDVKTIMEVSKLIFSGDNHFCELAYNFYSVRSDALSINFTGCMYQDGHGTKKDLKKSFDCFTKSIELGCKYAYFNKSWMYYEGNGCDQDYVQAEKNISAAIELKCPRAEETFEKFLKNPDFVNKVFKHKNKRLQEAEKLLDERQMFFRASNGLPLGDNLVGQALVASYIGNSVQN